MYFRVVSVLCRCCVFVNGIRRTLFMCLCVEYCVGMCPGQLVANSQRTSLRTFEPKVMRESRVNCRSVFGCDGFGVNFRECIYYVDVCMCGCVCVYVSV